MKKSQTLNQNFGNSLDTLQPRNVLLFSGHMVDAPTRPVARFPQDKVKIAETAIANALETLGAGPKDLALTQGASGGDLIFAQQCQQRGVHLQLLMPFPEAEFIKRSIEPSQGDWLERYHAVKAKLALPIQSLAKGPGSGNEDPFVACNLWLLNSATAYGSEKVRFICLWDGGGGDGPGGTAHMVEQIKATGGQVIWLDTRKLW
jgi:hypothetical protein